MSNVHIGDVVVVPDTQENPYVPRGGGLNGKARVEALTAWKHGKPTPGLAFWYAPFSGGARRIGPEAVNWETSGIK
jgi:hypothetical protein